MSERSGFSYHTTIWFFSFATYSDWYYDDEDFELPFDLFVAKQWKFAWTDRSKVFEYDECSNYRSWI